MRESLSNLLALSILDKNKPGGGPKWAKRIAIYNEQGEHVMAMTIEDMQKTKLTARGQSAAGNPTDDLTGPLNWVSSDGNVVAVNPLIFPEANAVAQGPLGTARVSVTGTNSRGDSITGFIDITVKAGPTVAILVEAGAPEPV